MSGAHCVVVWEWHDDHEGVWLPHSPAVTRALERAHVKKLTRVVLADADPDLKGHCVNLRTLTQTYDVPEGGVVECAVRRAEYGGAGARWQWLGRAGWHPLPMEVQCQLEEAFWSSSGEAVPFRGWRLCAARLQATPPPGALAAAPPRALRRDPQPPYPPAPPARAPGERKPRIPQQHTGSSVHSIQSIQSSQSAQSHHSMQSHHSIHSNHSLQSNHSVNSGHSLHSNHSMHSAQSMQSNHSIHANQSVHSTHPNRAICKVENEVTKDRKQKGLARQILHNLNIFSHNNKASCVAPPAEAPPPATPPAPAAPDPAPAPTPAAAPRDDVRARRHSVDTVSTYLSHESKDSSQAGGSLLDCSAGDAFLSPPQSPRCPLSPPQSPPPPIHPVFGAWLETVARPQWGAVCPECLAPLQPAAAPVVALPVCRHMLHLACLPRAQDTPYIECLVCGHIYGPQPPPLPSQRCLEPERLHETRTESPLPIRLHEKMSELPVPMRLHQQLSALELPGLHEKLCDLPSLRLHGSIDDLGTDMQEYDIPDLPAPMRLFDDLAELNLYDDDDSHYVQDCDDQVGGEAATGWAGAGAGAGSQPPGSMAWSVRPRAPPGYPPHTRSIVVTFSFQSGRQAAAHPRPGAPYYAVGFPRRTVLPDTPAGRQVLAALRRCWALGLLFTVRASRTTGREHVVAWSLPAPPAPAAPPALPALLHALRRALQAAESQ